MARRLFEAADAVLEDPDAARRIGRHLLDQHTGTEVAALLRSLGSVGELLKNVAATAAKYSSVTSMDIVDIDETSAGEDGGGVATIAAVTREGIVRA